MLRTHIGKSSSLFILFSVIQDHIESIGKPILLKGDEVLLNGLLAQMLRDIALKLPNRFLHPNMSKSKTPTWPHRFFLNGATEFI